MCTLCDRGKPQLHSTSRRNFLKGTAATGVAAGAIGLFGSSAEAQGHNVNPPPHTGKPGRRYVIRNGYVMTMEPGTPGANSSYGEFVEGDVLVDGKTIEAIGRNLHVGNATEIDARGKVVMPGFIDTHHHQAWTAIRSAIPDSILIDDGTGTASAEQNYFDNVLAGLSGTTGFARHYRPQDVYISELFGGLSQLDAGVTTVLDISQIHSEQRAGRGGDDDGADQRGDRYRRRKDSQVEGPAAGRQPGLAARAARGDTRLPLRRGRRYAEPIPRLVEKTPTARWRTRNFIPDREFGTCSRRRIATRGSCLRR